MEYCFGECRCGSVDVQTRLQDGEEATKMEEECKSWRRVDENCHNERSGEEHAIPLMGTALKAWKQHQRLKYHGQGFGMIPKIRELGTRFAEHRW